MNLALRHPSNRQYPPWVVLHVPHDSTEIPTAVRSQFLLDDVELERELVSITDHHTLAMFAGAAPGPVAVRAPVSRLVVDVERFQVDADEPMTGRGMGVIYARTSSLAPLRRNLSDQERAALLRAYYEPHHAKLKSAVDDVLQEHGRCLVLDCHSFPSIALPYEMAKPSAQRPDICIGTDDFHTSRELERAFVEAFEREGWRVRVNDPFAGALVPSSRYRRDVSVSAIMVEVSRHLYINETTAERLPDFESVAQRVRRCCIKATGTQLAPASRSGVGNDRRPPDFE